MEAGTSGAATRPQSANGSNPDVANLPGSPGALTGAYSSRVTVWRRDQVVLIRLAFYGLSPVSGKGACDPKDTLKAGSTVTRFPSKSMDSRRM